VKTVLGVFFVFILGACSTKQVKKGFSLGKPTFEQFLQDQQSREKYLEQIQGKIQIRYEGNEGSMTGNGKILKYQNQSRIEISDPMGRVRYWLLGDLDGTLAFYQTENKAYSASQGGVPYFRKFFGIALSWKEFQNLWMGVLPTQWRKKLQSNFQLSEPGRKISVEISDQSGQISAVKIDDLKNPWMMTLSDFDACCSFQGRELLLAHNIEIKIPGKDSKIGIEWEEANILDEAPNPVGFLRKLPKRTSLIELK